MYQLINQSLPKEIVMPCTMVFASQGTTDSPE